MAYFIKVTWHPNADTKIGYMLNVEQIVALVNVKEIPAEVIERQGMGHAKTMLTMAGAEGPMPLADDYEELSKKLLG